MLWALHDSDRARSEVEGSFRVDRDEAARLNQEGYGIFWTPNQFHGRRLIANVTGIRFWFCELDEGTKAEQVARLRRSPLLPTALVESKRGYHAYWKAKDATTERWKRITRWGVVPRMHGDPRATDVVRILRAPRFNHVKDPSKPFPVRTVWRLDTQYTELQMMRAFPDTRPQPKTSQERVSLEPGGSFWQHVGRMDCRVALLRLNGHRLVKGERFTLAAQGNGNANIIRADGYSTGCFIDAEGKLGNVVDGSSIAAWLKWYGWSWREIADGLKETFPELHDIASKEERGPQEDQEGGSGRGEELPA